MAQTPSCPPDPIMSSSPPPGHQAAKHFGSNANHVWGLPGLRWILGSEKFRGTLGLFPVNSSSPEKDAEEIQQHNPETFSSETGRTVQRLRQPCRNKKLQVCRAHYPAARPPGERGQEHPDPELLIKVSGLRDGLGISIAGGRGSLPFIQNDEGIFISRVSKGGPAEKAGVHIGDRVLEVNGQDMQGVSHHEAVSTLHQAGGCIEMKILRQRLEPAENRVSHEPEDSNAGLLIGYKENAINCSSLANRIEAVVCNGKGLSDLEQDRTAGSDTFKKKQSAGWDSRHDDTSNYSDSSLYLR
ncbi:protein scribble homolog [Silurus meridionalis]|uniref:protein scribble homolog n=1 Tax=Silurus meridionalis TaxID=175797 RepID=UPI001EECA33B|nr:protein scribble homolog [Silurus meridionalis]